MGFAGVPVVVPNAVDVSNFVKDFDSIELANLKYELEIKDDQKVIITTSRLVRKMESWT